MAKCTCEKLAAKITSDKNIFDITGEISFDIEDNGAIIGRIVFNSRPSVVKIPSSVQYNGRNYPVLSIKGFSYSPRIYEQITDKRKKDYGDWIWTGKYYSFKYASSIFHYYRGQGPWEYDVPDICEVILPNTIKTIGDNAFARLEKLERINIPKGTQSIGVRAFKYCKSLKTLDIPKSVKIIGDEAFDECGLKEVIINNKEGAVEFGQHAISSSASVKYTGKGLFSFLK